MSFIFIILHPFPVLLLVVFLLLEILGRFYFVTSLNPYLTNDIVTQISKTNNNFVFPQAFQHPAVNESLAIQYGMLQRISYLPRI